MGLAQIKSRSKISKDPNNTKWSKDATSFGQKIMRAQGWQPGEYLGAKGSRHSELHTAANASHIRVTLKDDNRGLGFLKAKEDEVTGLGVFQDLLGRLNGKTEDAIDQERKSRLAAKTVLYVDHKFGPMRFVRGGLLVGDHIKALAEEEGQDAAGDSALSEPSVSADAAKMKRRKRKGEEVASELSPEDCRRQKKLRKEDRKARKGLSAAKSAATTASSEVTSSESPSSHPVEGNGTIPDAEMAAQRTPESGQGDDDTRTAKKAKKEKKEKRREKKQKADAGKQENMAVDAGGDAKKKKRRRKGGDGDGDGDGTDPPTAVPSEVESAGATTPIPTGTSTPLSGLEGRHLSRSKFIAQKRRALVDVAALNQIFMVKSS